MVTRKVPAEAADQILELTRKHRQFRSDRRTVLAMHAQIQCLLDRYEESLTKQARRSLPFLSLKSKMSRGSEKTRAKPTGEQKQS